MNQKSSPVVFFGSGPVAAKSLELLAEWCEIEFVITKSKAIHHKDPAPTEEIAKKLNLKLHYANNKTALEELIYELQPKSTLGIVIDYGVIISEKTINYFEKGIINSHFSILPEWRGADPISFALLSGQKQTGVSLMLIDKGLDTGKLIATSVLEITESHDGPTLTNELIIMSNELLLSNLNQYINGDIEPVPQDKDSVVTYSPKIQKNDGLVDTAKSANQIAREVKTYIDWPKSKLMIGDTQIVITKAAAYSLPKVEQSKIMVTTDKIIYLGCRDSTLEILELKPPSKNNMSAASFLNGYAHILAN